MKKKIVITLILLLAVGFAAVSTTLFINGNVLFGTKEDDFDVYFSKAVIDGVEDNTVISSNGKTISYETGVLEVVGDKSILEYTVTNNSSQYDAEVVMTCELEENEYVRVDNTLQNEVIEAKSEKEGILTVELIKTSVNEIELEVNCTIEASAKERESIVDDPIIEGESSTYSLYGYLVDENEEVLPNTAVVIYSNPTYGTTDESGYIYLEEIEIGSHEIYIIGETTIEEIQSLSKEEIETNSITNIGITTNTANIVFPNGYKIVDSVIEKTKTVIVSFDANGADIEIEDRIYTIGKDLVYGELPEITREGYTFEGWYNEEDEKIEETTRVEKGEEHTLYARWTANTYAVTADSNSGTIATTTGWSGTGTSATKTVTYDGTYGTLPSVSRTGYTLKGWYTAASGGSAVTASTTVSTASNHTIYAQWTANTYTVAYNANGGTGTMASVSHTYGVAKNLTANTFTRSGYEFTGWNTNADGTGTTYANSASVTDLTTINDATVTLYAQWEKLVTVTSGTGSKAGDIISIGSEQFYVISNNGTNIKMMARYNLYIGGEWDGTTLTTYANPTGIQKSSMKGYTSTASISNPWRGVTAFGSNSTYSGSKVEGYVNTYSNYLKNTYGVENTATLITYNELVALGCVPTDFTCKDTPSWVSSTSYWTRSANGTTAVWSVYSIYTFSSNTYNNSYTFGVRPVVTISASLI